MCNASSSTWKSRSDSGEHWKRGAPFLGALEGGAPFCIPSVFSQQNITFADFKEYEEVPEAVTLDFTEDEVLWVMSKFSVTAGALEEKEIELRNWIILFGCTSEELRVIVAKLSDWMANSSPPLGRILLTNVLPPSSFG